MFFLVRVWLLIGLTTLLTKEECEYWSEVTFVEMITAYCKRKINHTIPPFLYVKVTPGIQQNVTSAQNQLVTYLFLCISMISWHNALGLSVLWWEKHMQLLVFLADKLCGATKLSPWGIPALHLHPKDCISTCEAWRNETSFPSKGRLWICRLQPQLSKWKHI